MDLKKILIVEDTAAISLDSIRSMRKSGYDVIATVSNVKKAVKSIYTLRPDLVLIDTSMNGRKNSIDAASAIQNHHQTPVVLLIDYEDDEKIEEVKLTNTYGYLLKPYRDKDLIQTIESAVYKADLDAGHQILENELLNMAKAYSHAQRLGRFGHWKMNVRSGQAVWSEGTYLLFGQNPDQFKPTYENFLKLVHPSDKKRLMKSMEKALSRAKTLDVEYRILHPDGNQRIIHSIAEIERESTGLATSLFGAVMDVTESRNIQNELEEKIQLNQTFFDALPCAAFIIQKNTKEIVFTNKAGKKLGAYAGAKCYEIWGRRKDSCPWCQAQEMLETGTPQHLEFEEYNTIWDAYWYPINDTLFLLYIFDVTEKRNMETRLQQAQKMEAIGTLAGGIAHDFNNILFPMMGFAEMAMEDTNMDEQSRHAVNEIMFGIKRAGDLVKQILTFSRQTDQELGPIKIQIIIKEILNLIRSTLPSTIEIRQFISNQCGVVKANSTLIHQIIMNLVTNAFHAMEESGGRLEITLKQLELDHDDIKDRPLTLGSYVCLAVSDTGVGIEKKALNYIFNPYFTTKEKGKGTGLGLSVVQRIVQKLNGYIIIDSEENMGTSVQVYLPVELGGYEKPEEASELPLKGGNEKILLVDDEEAIINMIQEMLDRLGYQVNAMTSSKQALALFQAQPKEFDLVITDLTMPEITGIQLTQKLKKIRPDIPIIICSGYSEDIYTDKIKTLDIEGFIMKPVQKAVLDRNIRNALDG